MDNGKLMLNLLRIEEALMLLEESRRRTRKNVHERSTSELIKRFKNILGGQFPIHFSETGSVYYAALSSANNISKTVYRNMPGKPATRLHRLIDCMRCLIGKANDREASLSDEPTLNKLAGMIKRNRKGDALDDVFLSALIEARKLSCQLYETMQKAADADAFSGALQTRRDLSE